MWQWQNSEHTARYGPRVGISCERLWMKVIVQAIQDAESNINSPQMRAEKYWATAWLTCGSDDFKQVCEMAGLNPQKAATQFRRYFAHQEAHSKLIGCNEQGQYFLRL